MNTTNPLINFLVETFNRFFLKSPKFFKIWKIITGIPVLIIALPNALEILNIHLPQIFNQHVQDVVGWAATAMFLMSFLPTQSTPVGVDERGNPLKVTDEKKLPFTDTSEKKALVKKDEVLDQLAVVDKVAPSVVNTPIKS